MRHSPIRALVPPGTYYGGREVREKVREYLVEESGPVTQTGPGRRMQVRRAARVCGWYTTRAGWRGECVLTTTPHWSNALLQSLGYQIPPVRRGRSAATKPATDDAPAPAAQQPPAPPSEPFTDVLLLSERAGEAEVAAIGGVAVAPALPREPLGVLTGTELEAAPERPFVRPVPVVKPGMAPPTPAAQQSSPKPIPRNVPVVKPQKRMTIGDMMRGGAAPPADASPSAPAADAAVEYNPDGSVVLKAKVRGGGRCASVGGRLLPLALPLASVLAMLLLLAHTPAPAAHHAQPIKLVKPARLLHKTLGMEDAAATGEGELEELAGVGGGDEPNVAVLGSYRQTRL